MLTQRVSVLVVLAAASTGCHITSPGAGAASEGEGRVIGVSRTRQIVEVKFREDLKVRLDGKQLRNWRGERLEPVHALLDRYRALEVRALMSLSVEQLETFARRAQALSGERVPDMASWYQVFLPADADTDRFVAELVSLSEVSTAYRAPEPAPPPTPSSPPH